MASPSAMSLLVIIFFFFFLHATQLAVFQVQARDIRNFNKVTRSETKNDDQAATAPSPAEDDPVFLPQTGHTGYGLWGHQPTTTTSTTTFPSYNYNAYGNTDQRYEIDQTKQHHDIPINNFHYKNYAPQLAGLDGRRSGTRTTVVDGRSNGAYDNNINDERQAGIMSNTRFVDNANYFYNTNTDTAAGIGSLDYNNNIRSSNQYYSNNNNNHIYGQSFNNGFQAARAQHQMDDDVQDDFDP